MCAQENPATEAPQKNRITPIQWVGLGALILLGMYKLGFLNLASFQSRIPFFIALVYGITIHEFSHGLVATLFGDSVPRRAGRLTLNPLKHLDPIGSILILSGAPIGWGRPMPINPNEMRHPALGWALSSAAGPISNLLSAAVLVIGVTLFNVLADPTLRPYFTALIAVNVGLAVFNFVPLPPLDGFGFIYGLAPRSIKVLLSPIQTYGPLILLALLFVPSMVPGLPNPLSDAINWGNGLVYDLLEGLANAI